MLRNCGLAPWPPAPMTIALRARMVQRLCAVLDVAVLPEALETRARLRVESRRIAGSDTQHPSRELLFPDDLVHVTVQDEPDTFFTCAVLQAPRERSAVGARPRAGDLGAVLHQARRKVARTDAPDAGVLPRDGSPLDVSRLALHEQGRGASGSRHPAIAVRAGYPCHADVVRHQEFPGGVAVVGIGAMEVAFVVPVGRLRRGVHHRPVGMIPEQEVGILGELRRRVRWRGGDETLRIALASDVPELQGISAAKRNPSPTVQHLAADVEVLIDDNHGCAQVARPDGGGQAGAPCADDYDVRLVMPTNRVRRGALRQRRSRRG